MSALPRIRARKSFSEVVGRTLHRGQLGIVQINVGKLCNQACLHCHVEAGPKRTEIMSSQTVDRIIDLLKGAKGQVHTVDLTGGAPEMMPDFRRLVLAARALNIKVIDRCNLTVLHLAGQEDTAKFLAENGVEVVASLPCYSKTNVEQQRGKGVFGESISALQQLNLLGYGRPGTGLVLNLVYNPGGPSLPPAQSGLERDYKERLQEDFGVVFNHLFTITNMPIARFRTDLERSDQLENYMQLLLDNYNPATVDGVMCLDQISISWDGRLFDCDFNQMLEIRAPFKARTVFELDSFDALSGQRVAVADHCFGCTAGAGSSCGGTLD